MELKMNQLRIIAGAWRGRKISFYQHAGTRPTLDRIRETVFNWLQMRAVGANCLDLFAGSGILGIEALSRGANSVAFFDNHQEVIKTIRQSLAKFDAENNQCYQSSLPKGLAELVSKKYDIIFLDPPYHTSLLQQCLDYLAQHKLLTDNGVIYFEAGIDDAIDFSHFEILRHKKTKTLQYGLLAI